MTFESVYLRTFEVLPHAFILPFSIWTLYLPLTLFTARYAVNLTGFRREGVRGKKYVKWQQVEEV